MPSISSTCSLSSSPWKTLYPQQFIKALRATSISKPFLLPVAILTIATEFLSAIGLLFIWSLVLTWIGVIILLSGFTAWMARMYAHKVSLDCGCFGPARSAVSIGALLRNIIFLGIALSGLFLTFHTTSLLPVFSLWVALIALLSLAGMIFLMVRRLRPYFGKHVIVPSSQAVHSL